MMHVLHLLAPQAIGGIETVVSALARGTRERGLRVSVIAMARAGSPGAGWADRLSTDGPAVGRLEPTRRPWRDAQALAREIARLRPDVLHAHGYRADVLGALAPLGSTVRRLATVHGFTATDLKGALYERADLLALRRFDRVHAVAAPIACRVVRAGVAEDRVVTILNGVGVAATAGPRDLLRKALGLSADALAIGCVGRLSPEKGHADLLAAFARLAPGMPAAELLLVGDGPERARLESLAAELGIAARVRFLGIRRDLERMLPALDLFVLPSHTEGCPTALQEAMAFGLPSVATAVGAVPDLVRDGVEGRLVPPRAPGPLSQAMRDVLTRPEAAMTMGRAARARYAAEFALAPWLDRMVGLYTAMLQP